MARIAAQRVHVLTERRPSICRLAPCDVDMLQAAHRTHIAVAPTGQRHYFQLTPAGYVGTLSLPESRLVLRPKLPLRNLFYLLDPAGPAPLANDCLQGSASDGLLEFFADRLVQLLEERLRAGLHRTYVERQTVGPVLQGRLDVSTQARAPGGRKDRLHGRADDWSVGNRWNQIPKAAVIRLREQPSLGAARRAALGRLLAELADVQSRSIGAADWAACHLDRQTIAYAPLLDWCRLLLDSLAPDLQSGTSLAPSFLVSLDRVFERYVAEGLRIHLHRPPAQTLLTQPTHLLTAASQGPDWEIRPDFLLQSPEAPVWIGDAKWKRLRPSRLPGADMYQIAAYAILFKVSRAFLVFPGRKSTCWRYSLGREPITLEVYRLPVTGSRSACRIALARWARGLRPRG